MRADLAETEQKLQKHRRVNFARVHQSLELGIETTLNPTIEVALFLRAELELALLNNGLLREKMRDLLFENLNRAAESEVADDGLQLEDAL